MHEALIPSQQVDDFVILRARAFTSKLRRTMARDVLQDEGMTLMEWQLLFSIARFGTCHLAHITRHTSIDPAHGSRAAATLEKAGQIERHDDPENRRRKLISLTSAGQDTFSRIWPRAKAVHGSVTDQMDPQDFAELKRLLDLLNAAAEPLMTTSFDFSKTEKDTLSAAE